jgi:tRNA nucleotidyltransferase (CCA-adding enzyme)
VAGHLPVRITRHSTFRTVVIAWPDGREWDLVSARRERYPHPGALPVIARATLADDLARRDFALNALAADLAAARWGRLVDPGGALADLRSRRLRVLHDASFRDDPTRLFRLLRYAAGLRLKIEEQTARYFTAALETDALDTISADRVRAELERSLSRDDAPAQARRLLASGLAAAVHPGFVMHARRLAHTRRLLADVGNGLQRWLVWLAACVADEALETVASRLNLEGSARRVLETLARRAALPRPRTASAMAAWLDGLPVETALAVAARRPALADDVLRYLREWRYVTPHLSGHDVLAMGCPRGPRVGRVLEALRAARLDGTALTVDDERALAAALLARDDHD